VPDGRRNRTVVVVDNHRTASSEQADLFVQVEPDRDFDALWTLRSLVRGIEPPESAATGASIEVLADLARRMKECRSGVAFFGLGLSRQGLGHHNVEALLLLVRDLNDHTRFYARRMRLYGDVAGADCVLCWQTGYPFSVNLARGYPRFNPEEFSAVGVLERQEVDACVIVGSETLDQFPESALAQLRRIPTVVLDYPEVEPLIAPTVRFTTAIYGMHRPGTAYRMDEVPIPLRAFIRSSYPSDDEVLAALLARL
jgi:formylmethanofuran dehydrogenase subunit B